VSHLELRCTVLFLSIPSSHCDPVTMALSMQQNVYTDTVHDLIVVDDVHENAISPAILRRLLDSAQGADSVGMAATYRRSCSLSCLAFATPTRALVIHFSVPKKSNQPNEEKRQEQQPPISRGRALLRDHILCNPDIQLYGYRMDRIAVALFLDLDLQINAAVDILSVSTGQDGRRSLQAIVSALGGELLLQKKNVKTLFFGRIKGDSVVITKAVALQAWAACCAAMLPHMAPRYAALSRIATDTIPDVVCNLQ
jgi:hypothetical protein